MYLVAARMLSVYSIGISQAAGKIVIMSGGWYKRCCRAYGVEQRHL